MEERQVINILKVRVFELEDKLMDIIEIANQYPEIPVPIFEEKIDLILTEIEFLHKLI